jgi:hypothetical protein
MRLTLGRKLSLGFATILALMAVSSVLSYRKSSQIKEIEHFILTNRVPSISNEIFPRFARLSKQN